MLSTGTVLYNLHCVSTQHMPLLALNMRLLLLPEMCLHTSAPCRLEVEGYTGMQIKLSPPLQVAMVWHTQCWTPLDLHA